jgi:hypothetical protein
LIHIAALVSHTKSVHPELVEGLSFLFSHTGEGKPFDKLRANGKY